MQLPVLPFRFRPPFLSSSISPSRASLCLRLYSALHIYIPTHTHRNPAAPTSPCLLARWCRRGAFSRVCFVSRAPCFCKHPQKTIRMIDGARHTGHIEPDRGCCHNAHLVI